MEAKFTAFQNERKSHFFGEDALGFGGPQHKALDVAAPSRRCSLLVLRMSFKGQAGPSNPQEYSALQLGPSPCPGDPRSRALAGTLAAPLIPSKCQLCRHRRWSHIWPGRLLTQVLGDTGHGGLVTVRVHGCLKHPPSYVHPPPTLRARAQAAPILSCLAVHKSPRRRGS